MYSLGFDVAGSDPAEAARWYRRAAEAGEVGAMFNLGLLLKKRDRRESERWLEQAALRDHANAMNTLAYSIFWRHPFESRRWTRLAAEKGNANAMTMMASDAKTRSLFAFGAARRRLVTEHVTWLKKAAELGNAEAMWRLGLHYQGVSDEVEARRWTQAAAQEGYEPAQITLERGTKLRSLVRILRAMIRLNRPRP